MRKVLVADLADGAEIVGDSGHFEYSSNDVVFAYEVEVGGGLIQRGIRFLGVRAFQFRGEVECTAWQITDIYNRMAEVEDSSWLTELLQTAAARNAGWAMHHYMLYREDIGCFEVAAASWSWMPELNL